MKTVQSAPFLCPKKHDMDDELIIQRLMELKAQIANFDERLAGLDNPLADGLTDEAVHRYARELSKIIEEREPVLNEIRQWLMLLDKPADGEPLPN